MRRVGHQTAGNVRPVFIHVGLNRARNNRARDIAAAAGKGFDVAVRIASVKARHNRALMSGQQRAELFLCLIAVQPPLFVKENALLRIDEIPAEIICQQNAVEVFAPAGGVIRARAELNVAAHFIQIPIQINRQPKLLRNAVVARANRIKSRREIAAGRRQAVALIKQIGHFDIGGSAFARRARHDQCADPRRKAESPTFLNCAASASELPPNFATFIPIRKPSDFLLFHFPAAWAEKSRNNTLKREADTILKNVLRKVKSYSSLCAKNAVLCRMARMFSRFFAPWDVQAALSRLTPSYAPVQTRVSAGRPDAVFPATEKTGPRPASFPDMPPAT